MIVTLENILIFEEGLRLEPYLCPAGHWSLAVGWNLEAHGLPSWACKEFFDSRLSGPAKISRETAMRMLDVSIELAVKDAFRWYDTGRRQGFKDIDPPGMNDARRRACENMAFQLGYTRLAGFVKTRKYIQAGEWEKAAEECKDSKWAREDSPQRAGRVSRVFRTGDDAFYKELL